MKFKLTLKEREEWWINTIGYVPTEEQLTILVREEPGLATLISMVFNLNKLYQERRKEDNNGK